MNETILKKLDSLMNEANQMLDQGNPQGYFAQQWAPLRAELAAERCENCMYWGDNHRCLSATVQHQLGRLGREMPFTSATFGCMYFWAKKEKS